MKIICASENVAYASVNRFREQINLFTLSEDARQLLKLLREKNILSKTWQKELGLVSAKPIPAATPQSFTETMIGLAKTCTCL